MLIVLVQSPARTVQVGEEMKPMPIAIFASLSSVLAFYFHRPLSVEAMMEEEATPSMLRISFLWLGISFKYNWDTDNRSSMTAMLHIDPW